MKGNRLHECPICHNFFQSLGIARHRAMHTDQARREEAQQDNIVDLQTDNQQPQPKICPCCHGAKVDKNIYGIANSKPCAVCNGTGKLRASA